jgi:hypothetical protein
LRGSKNLQRLDIRQPFDTLEVPPAHAICDRLKHLVLSGFDRHISQAATHATGVAFPYVFLARIAKNIEHLHLIDLPWRWTMPESEDRLIPLMPNLKYLRLEQTQLFTSTIPIVSCPIVPARRFFFPFDSTV